MTGLIQEYDNKINFVMLVANDETTAQAMAQANSLGFGKFLDANKKTISTVAVFKGSNQVSKIAKTSIKVMMSPLLKKP
jgi:hypothetical protein